jgi:hypothetical protein
MDMENNSEIILTGKKLVIFHYSSQANCTTESSSNRGGGLAKEMTNLAYEAR